MKDLQPETKQFIAVLLEESKSAFGGDRGQSEDALMGLLLDVYLGATALSLSNGHGKLNKAANLVKQRARELSGLVHESSSSSAIDSVIDKEISFIINTIETLSDKYKNKDKKKILELLLGQNHLESFWFKNRQHVPNVSLVVREVCSCLPSNMNTEAAIHTLKSTRKDRESMESRTLELLTTIQLANSQRQVSETKTKVGAVERLQSMAIHG